MSNSSHAGAAQQLADPRTLIDAGSDDVSRARRPPCRAVRLHAGTVEQREELAVDMEHDCRGRRRNHLVAAGRDLRGAGDDMARHF